MNAKHMNKWLKGCGYWCPDCGGTGDGATTDILEYDSGARLRFYHPCQTCKGDGRIEATIEQVLTGTVPNNKGPGHHAILRPIMRRVSA